jgi:hypothetical protein
MIVKLSTIIALPFIFAYIRAKEDFAVISKGKKINHVLNAFVTIIISLIIALAVDYRLFILPIFCYWLFFDAILNKLRSKAWLFVGTTATIDKTFRFFFYGYAGIVMLVVKLSLLIEFIYIAIVYGK